MGVHFPDRRLWLISTLRSPSACLLPAGKQIPSFEECVADPVGWQIAPAKLVHLHLVTDERILTDFAAARRARW
jgi:hypothetical protein